MDSPLKSPNGNTPVRVTIVEDEGHAGGITRMATCRGPTNPDGHTR